MEFEIPRARGFTIVEALAVVLLIALLVGILLPGMHGRTRCGHRFIRDATQVRSIVQAMVVFAGQNGGAYPLPSRLDAANATVAPAGDPALKDNTGNLLSILIYQGMIAPELCISPAESNTDQVVRDDRYEYSEPASAVAGGGDPKAALWDPGFAGTPLDAEPYRRRGQNGTAVSHQSYAQAVPVGARAAAWADTSSPTQAVFGNRGPGYRETSAPADRGWRLNPPGAAVPGEDSGTLLIHGGRRTWEGNIAYADGHVTFETRPDPDGLVYRRAGQAKAAAPDNLFVDELDEAVADGAASPGRTNNFLRPIARFPVSGGPLTEGRSGTPDLWVD